MSSYISKDDAGPRHDGLIGETDPNVLARRQRQIDYGKNTDSYQLYEETFPDKKDREPAHACPLTPNKYDKYSRRAFDGLIRSWKRDLHSWATLKIAATTLKRSSGAGTEGTNTSVADVSISTDSGTEEQESS